MSSTVNGRTSGLPPALASDGGVKVSVVGGSLTPPVGASATQVQGTEADNAVAVGSPVRLAGIATNPTAIPAAATAGRSVGILTDLFRRIMAWAYAQGTTADDAAISSGSGNPVIAGGVAASPSALPSAATATRAVTLITDTFRRLITLSSAQGTTADNVAGTSGYTNPVLVGGVMASPTSLPSAGTATRVGNMLLDTSRRVINYLGVALDPVNDGISSYRGTRSVTPTVTGSTSPAYSIGDAVGGILTLTTTNYASARNAILQTLTLTDKSGTGPALTIYLFKATPTGGTYTDNTGIAWGSGDAANCVGAFKILASDWVSVGGQKTVTLSGIEAMFPVTSTSAFMLIAAESVFTLAATTNLTLVTNFERV